MLPYYKILTVPNLEQISHELDQALPELVTGRFDLKAVYSFNMVDPALVLNLAPTLAAWLDTVGLKNNLNGAAFPWAAPASVGGVHTDLRPRYPDLPSEAINFPVYNCERGYSVWCQANRDGAPSTAENGKSTDALDRSADYRPYALPKQRLHLTQIPTADNPELARVSTQCPVWFNTGIPHRGINFSDRPRIILTMRFDCPINIDAL
jgi:hypothetical protein